MPMWIKELLVRRAKVDAKVNGGGMATGGQKDAVNFSGCQYEYMLTEDQTHLPIPFPSLATQNVTANLTREGMGKTLNQTQDI